MSIDRVMMIERMDYIAREVELPGRVSALTSIDPDGIANIYVNTRLSPGAKQNAMRHELRHLCRLDFWNAASIQLVEA